MVVVLGKRGYDIVVNQRKGDEAMIRQDVDDLIFGSDYTAVSDR